MSELGAINASNIAFQGSKETKEAKETKTAQTTDNKPKLTDRFTQPFRDEFKKAYGEDAEATPTLVADFVSDNVVKLGVFAAGGALLLAKSRKATNGLTEAIKDNINKFKSAATEGEKAGIFKKTVDTIKGTFSQIKSNNLEAAKEAAEEAAKTGSKTLKQTFEGAILRSKEFQEGTQLAGIVDRCFGKNAAKVKGFLGKIGISNGSDLADTAIAGTATVALSSSVNEIAGDVTKKDNAKLARQAKLENTKAKVQGKMAEVAEAEAARATLKVSLAKIEQQLSDKQKKRVAVQDAIEAAEDDLQAAQCEEEIAKLNLDIAKLKASRAELIANIAGKDADIADLRVQADSIQTTETRENIMRNLGKFAQSAELLMQTVG